MLNRQRCNILNHLRLYKLYKASLCQPSDEYQKARRLYHH
ncbi:MAG: tetratricopeptide repeat protein [Anaerolineales bacterium]|nr:tetratricopeptide repeat protein [Anaerolineales bacterium]